MTVKRGKFSSLTAGAKADSPEVDAAEEEARIDNEIADRLKAMPPSSRMMFNRVCGSVPVAVVSRLHARKSTFVVVRIASHEWREAAFQAVWMALDHAVRTDFMLYGVQHHHIPADEIANRAWQRKSQRERTLHVLSTLASGITIVALSPGEELDRAALVIADMECDLTTIDVTDFDAIMAHAFPGSSYTWSSELVMSTVEPRWIDLAIGRSITADEALQMIAAIHDRPPENSEGPGLEDLHGYGLAREWGERLVAALKDFRAGQLTWDDVDAGALLVGPPGTGKTLFASALARSSGLSFFPTSYAAWQSAGEGHLGSVLKSMRRVFSEASAATPALIFIDEIDTLLARGASQRNDDWWRTINNALLEALDGTARREGVIVIAACNDDANLDPALVRSGRLDRRFVVGLPDEADLSKILAHHLPSVSEGDIQAIAVTLAGSASGADAARIARDARQRARTEGRAVTGADLLAVALPADDRPQIIRRRIAVHEAGHAVAILSRGSVPTSLSVAAASGGRVTYDRHQTELILPDFSTQLSIQLAGRAAEEVVLGSVSAGAGGPAQSDLGKATGLAEMIEGRLGLGSRIGVVESVDEAAVERRLRMAYADALLAAMRHRHAIEALADLALEKRVLGKAALAEFWHSLKPTELPIINMKKGR